MTAELFATLGLVENVAWIAIELMTRAGRQSGQTQDAAQRSARRTLAGLVMPAMVLKVVCDFIGQGVNPALVAADAIYVVGVTSAWLTRDKDDDDWWKKLRDKASGVVKNLGHRLTVVPEPAGAA